jgi:hypothetical protein
MCWRWTKCSSRPLGDSFRISLRWVTPPAASPSRFSEHRPFTVLNCSAYTDPPCHPQLIMDVTSCRQVCIGVNFHRRATASPGATPNWSIQPGLLGLTGSANPHNPPLSNPHPLNHGLYIRIEKKKTRKKWSKI